MHIPVFTTKYRASKFATAIDTICSYGMVFEILLLLSLFRILEKRDWLIAIVVFVVMALAKFIVIPKYAEIAFENHKKKAIENRKSLKYQHIVPLNFQNNELTINCPKCGEPVKISHKCSCGCDIWKTDLWFQHEIEEIYKQKGLKYER